MNFTKIMTQIAAFLKTNTSSATRKYMVKDFICHLSQNSYNTASASLLVTELYKNVATDHRGSVIITCATTLSHK